MKKIVSQIIPKGQKEIIKRALELQYIVIDGYGLQCDDIEYIKHDIRSLIAFLDYDISVTLSKVMMDKFSFIHGVDFPEYTDVEAKYPIEVESEWVTVIVGDYDGRIEFGSNEEEDTREYQLVDVPTSTTSTKTFDLLINDGGYNKHYITLISELTIGGLLEIHSGEVYIIRIK